MDKNSQQSQSNSRSDDTTPPNMIKVPSMLQIYKQLKGSKSKQNNYQFCQQKEFQNQQHATSYQQLSTVKIMLQDAKKQQKNLKPIKCMNDARQFIKNQLPSQRKKWNILKQTSHRYNNDSYSDDNNSSRNYYYSQFVTLKQFLQEKQYTLINLTMRFNELDQQIVMLEFQVERYIEIMDFQRQKAKQFVHH